MTPRERGHLIRRLARPPEDVLPPRWLQRRARDGRLLLIVGSVVVLVPWIVYLGVTLPRNYVAVNWDKTWVGFDLLLLVLLLATAVLALLRRQLVALTAFATSVLLLCDAWFDVMTSHGEDKTWSLATALVVELPLAAVLLMGSFKVVSMSASRLSNLGHGRYAWQVQIPLPGDPDPAVPRASSTADAQNS